MTINRKPSYSPSDSPSYSSNSLLFCDDPITPYTLFAYGAQGIFLDPSNFSTLFQDAAGTIPVTKLGQNVGKILDLSGRGNHVVQATAASQWTIQARKNLFTKTAEITDSAWDFAGGTKTGGQVGNRGTTTACLFAGPSTGVPARAITATDTKITYSIFVKWGSGATVNRQFLMRNITTSTNFDSLIVNTQTGAIVSGEGWTVTAAGNGYFKLVYARSAGISVGDTIYLYYGSTGARPDSDSWLIDEPQLEVGTAATTYQQVNTATDYTDIGLSPYLELDGVDDSAATAAIDFSMTDNISIWSGVRKESDAAAAIVIELGPDASANAGTFFVSAPDTAADNFGARAGGTVSVSLSQAGHTAPKTALLFAQMKISTDLLSLSVNGGTPTTSAADQGTGNYAAAQPLNFGRRNNTNLPFKGRLYAQCVYSGLVSEAEQKQISKWFYARMPAV